MGRGWGSERVGEKHQVKSHVLNGSESRTLTDDLRVYHHGSLKIPRVKIVSESIEKKGSCSLNGKTLLMRSWHSTWQERKIFGC